MSDLQEKLQCRLCLCKPSVTFSLIDDEDFIELIENFTSIKITQDDNLPTICCSQCFDDIFFLTNFRSRIIESDKILRQQNQTQNNSNDIEQVFLIKNEEGDEEEDVVEVIPERTPTPPPPPVTKTKIATTPTKTKSLNATCTICGTQVRRTNYKKHLQCHDSVPQICELCGATAKNAESLRGHMFYMHRSSAEQYKCKHCGRFFRYKYKFDLHVRKAHGGDRTHICEVCGKAFFTFREVKSHIQMTHMKLRPYICEYCGKGFSSSYARRTHIRQHTDERPFKCEVCAEGFRQRVSLRTHLRSKHGISSIGEVSLSATDVGLNQHTEMVKVEEVNV